MVKRENGKKASRACRGERTKQKGEEKVGSCEEECVQQGKGGKEEDYVVAPAFRSPSSFWEACLSCN